MEGMHAPPHLSRRGEAGEEEAMRGSKTDDNPTERGSDGDVVSDAGVTDQPAVRSEEKTTSTENMETDEAKEGEGKKMQSDLERDDMENDTHGARNSTHSSTDGADSDKHSIPSSVTNIEEDCIPSSMHGKEKDRQSTPKSVKGMEKNRDSKPSSVHPYPPLRTKNRKLAGHENEAFVDDVADGGREATPGEGPHNTSTPPGVPTPHPDPTSPDSKASTSAQDAEGRSEGVRLRKELGLLSCVGLIMGNIIGSGIFVSPRAVLQYTGSVGMSLVVWVLSGIVSMLGALCYAELGTMIPQSGGTYTYLHEAFGPLPAFLYLWMLVAINIPGTRAIGALTFANYILQPFFPIGQAPPQSALRLVAVLLILILTYINTRKVRWATRVQDSLALTKVFALIVIILVGLYYLASGRTEHYQDPMGGTNWNPAFIATAFYHTYYAYDGWDSLNTITEEVKDPFKNMPRAIAISICSVIVIYVLTNISYFAVIDKEQMLSSAAVAVTFGQLALGAVAWIVPIFVACSSGGSLNGAIFATARTLFVSSRRGHLPKVLSHVHVKNHTPVTALAFTAAISMVMFVTSNVTILINYTGFAANLASLGCIGSFFYFRIKQPDLHRPIKIWLGFPIIYFILSFFLTIFPLIRKPMEAVAAAVVMGTGLPVYYLAVHRQEKPKAFTRGMDKLTYFAQMVFLAVPEEREEEEEEKRQHEEEE